MAIFAGSLQGLKVIDLSRVLGGPYCTQILADHGADVLKIEPPQGDETRAWGPPFRDGVASYFIGLNRNKTGRTMDLSQPAERAELLALLESADVLVENFKTGTMERWGLGFEALHERFPRLVHCRVTGFGTDGPLGGLPGYDAAVQALAGLMSVNGEAGGEPLRVGLPVVDMVTGLNAALGILFALNERAQSGRGQFVEASLYDCGPSLLHPHTASWLLDGRTPQRSGNAHPNIYPYDTFATRDQPIFLAVGRLERRIDDWILEAFRLDCLVVRLCCFWISACPPSSCMRSRRAGCLSSDRRRRPSNIGNYLASLGVPALSGFGVKGEGIHAANERVALESIEPVYGIYRNALSRLHRP